ncbi:uncharacterized protein LTR77_010795 [Saxophila tyrrhenica]|uniref:NAD(P)-binding protein n=1 Tax=Saxophila tyrrhenica TaxID=1690608 RepID=A0AAV9NV56_9PEZI|nr:hypothetical protein LTR77_010795 [Saxophila tyrrhenica]
MASNSLITLITGGNSGIGKSLAGLLVADANRHVIITSRSIDKGNAAVEEIKGLKQPGKIEMVQLDLTVPSSITALAKDIETRYGRLDALVNNAAIADFPPNTPLPERMETSFKANVTGPLLMLEAFWPLLMKSTTTPRIINHSSGAGSMQIVKNMPDWAFGEVPIPYFSSKAALNMVSCSWMLGHRGEDYKMFTYCPGFTESNLGPHNKLANGAKPVVEGARPMVAILDGEKDAEHGGFLNHEGGQHPW